MEPDVGALGIAALDQPGARQLEVLLELTRDRDGLRRSLEQEKIPCIPRAARELEGLEVFVTVNPRFGSLAPIPPFEESDDRYAVREQAGQLFGRPLQEAVLRRVQVEVRIEVRIGRNPVGQEHRGERAFSPDPADLDVPYRIHV